ncbi:MAG TPA: glutamine synthetase family protein [Kofleriaceae bacterium]|nr:glutamine synthetase family protein [Kofleriaceae bacterium]
MSRLPDWCQAGAIDTVVVAFPDVLGRLMGKRFTFEFFRDAVLAAGTHACNYLLTVDVEQNPLPGFDLASWDKGYGDFHLVPDLTTLRPIPWQPATALVLADVVTDDHADVLEAPRATLRAQLRRLAERGLSARTASELEFFLYRESYQSCTEKQWRGLDPTSLYLVDYNLTQTSGVEPLMARVRKQLTQAGVVVEGTKGEWGKGQHEINLLYCEALEAADRHVLLKHGMKEMAAQDAHAVTFMAKPYTDEAGSSCHVHLSLWDADGRDNLFAGEGQPSRLFRQFLGGLMAHARELSYFFAPTVNSYKRYQKGSWAPTAMVWAVDNRTTGFRVVGEGRSLRIENRMPGADANPYLAYAAMIAAGLAGVEGELDCGDPYRKNAYADDSLPTLPASLAEAAELLDRSRVARDGFGDRVIDFHVHTARLEAAAAARAVTDWERARYFERV